MTSNTRAVGIKLTEAIKRYVQDKLAHVVKLIPERDDSAIMEVELAKTTKHHKSGHGAYRASVTLHAAHKDCHAAASNDDLYAAIDEVKDEIVRQLKAKNKKVVSLTKRGGRKAKEALHEV